MEFYFWQGKNNVTFIFAGRRFPRGRVRWLPGSPLPDPGSQGSREATQSAVRGPIGVSHCLLYWSPRCVPPACTVLRGGAAVGGPAGLTRGGACKIFTMTQSRDLRETWAPALWTTCSGRKSLILWRSLRDSNPCYSLERAMSWASRRRERGAACFRSAVL